MKYANITFTYEVCKYNKMQEKRQGGASLPPPAANKNISIIPYAININPKTKQIQLCKYSEKWTPTKVTHRKITAINIWVFY